MKTMDVESSSSPTARGVRSTQIIADVEAEIRLGFVRKVYGILVFQLMLTAIIAGSIFSMDDQWLGQHAWLAQTAGLVSLVVVLGVMCCCMEASRTYPQNYIFLFVVTVCESILVGFISVRYETQSVVIAAGLTAGIFAALTLYACTTKTDFTGIGPYLFAGLVGMIFMGFLMMLMGGDVAHKVMAGVGAILFSFYIVYDTQLIIGGGHKHQFGIDDYVFAALNIYLDIINLFIYILQLLGDRREG